MEKTKRDHQITVVSDTTPIISLMKIERLYLMKQLFDEVKLPEAVYMELVSNRQFEKERRQIEESSFIKIVCVENNEAVDLLRKTTGLDKGESEAIILSASCGADLLLMDEVKGRLVAKQRGLHLMGTVGMLQAAYQEKLMSRKDIEACINVLKSNGRHISDKLFQQLLDTIQQ